MRLTLLAALAALLASCAPTGPRPSTLGHTPMWNSPGAFDQRQFCMHEEEGNCRVIDPSSSNEQNHAD